MNIMEFIRYPLMICAATICFLCFLYQLKKKSLLPDWPSVLFNVHRGRFHYWLTELLSKNSGTYLIKGPWFTNMDTMITCDPANLRHVLNTNFSNYGKGGELHEILDVLGDGIFNADSDSWKTQRKLANQLINHHKFQNFLVQTICSKLRSGLIPVLEHVCNNNLVVDLQDVLKGLTLDLSVSLLVGTDLGTLGTGKSPYVHALDDLEEALFYRHVTPAIIWKSLRWLGIGIEKKHRDATQCIDQLMALLIAARRNKMNKHKADEDDVDLLGSYMEEDDVGGSKSDKFLRDTMLSFISAGTSTVSVALIWFFWLVSQNPEVEGKILEEITSKGISPSFTTQEGKKVGMFSMEDLKTLVYLHGALCEALRLFSPVPFNHKRPVEPDILPSGHRVDSTTRVVPIFYSVGRMEYVWGKDCLEFKPERWISADGGIQFESSYKFAVFNSGPRACLGKDMSFTQMRMIAATILYNYHVEALDGPSISIQNSIVLHKKHGMQVKIKRRY